MFRLPQIARPVPRPARFPLPKPASPLTLQVIVLPTINGNVVFHSRFLTPRTPFERSALVLGYVFRKWRYQISDFFAAYWNRLGHSCSLASPAALGLWKTVSRWVTRRSVDEYFLKTVPSITQNIEFLYPPSLNEALLKSQISNWIQDDKHRRMLVIWSIFFPGSLYIAKVHVALANLFFTYNVFRVNSHYRAHYGFRTLRKLIDERKVAWIPSPELESAIKTITDELSQTNVANGLKPLQFHPLKDMDDEVVTRLEQDLKAVELSRSYRRTRTEYYLYNYHLVPDRKAVS
ncbi:uncharacterized protein BJ171DRAFT_182632 [Polychytrium aggregatum]|uniref:uncharacterized protein n=1 Tax=Polychytrium aggregatum TaxID=110093 RepID=UPI0022FE0795|nr:uncharacterized protein BJ171DRAFT_182632 [Polychytrium aggregatum]KAI9202281.1 hypothetical protein BJ171DRAFT_182632 [Polychytrium aggregatum]